MILGVFLAGLIGGSIVAGLPLIHYANAQWRARLKAEQAAANSDWWQQKAEEHLATISRLQGRANRFQASYAEYHAGLKRLIESIADPYNDPGWPAEKTA